MAHFFLIRHGETDWNKQGLLQGHSDIPLNEVGKEQALRLGKELRKQNIQAIYASDLKRANETAQLIAEQNKMKIELSPHLREVHLGKAEGLPRQDIAKTFGQELWDNWISQDIQNFHHSFPEGESRLQALERFSKFIAQVLRKYQAPDQGPVAFVTHGLILRAFTVSHNPGMKLELLIPNCSVLRFSWPRGQENAQFIEQLYK